MGTFDWKEAFKYLAFVYGTLALCIVVALLTSHVSFWFMPGALFLASLFAAYKVGRL